MENSFLLELSKDATSSDNLNDGDGDDYIIAVKKRRMKSGFADSLWSNMK